MSKDRIWLEQALKSRRITDTLLRWLRACAVCSSPVPPIDLLCGRCWTELGRVLNRNDAVEQSGYPFPVYSLLTWSPEDDESVRSLLQAFKGGYAVRAAETLVSHLLFELGARRSLPSDLVWVLPPSHQGRLDHAGLLAASLCKFLPSSEAIRLESLPQGEKRSQKTKSLEERSKRRFKQAFSEAHRPDVTFVFIDDVITTGSTAMAAYMALNDPEHFEVWALASRPKLAGKTAI